MNSVTFDTLKYAKQLEDGGTSRSQAEAQAIAQKQSLTEALVDVASKSEMDALKKDSDSYKGDIAIIKTALAVLKWMVGTAIRVS